MVGPKVYERFVSLVQERERMRSQGVALPHPAVRNRRGDSADAAAAGS